MNSDNFKLKVELVPRTSWYSNVRTNVSVEEWNVIRRKTYKKAGYICEVCGSSGLVQGFRYPVECHEIWDYNEDTCLQTLKGFICLCPLCHKCKHVGFAELNGCLPEAIEHLSLVNGASKDDIVLYIEDCFSEYKRRSRLTWRLDISYIEEYLKVPDPRIGVLSQGYYEHADFLCDAFDIAKDLLLKKRYGAGGGGDITIDDLEWVVGVAGSIYSDICKMLLSDGAKENGDGTTGDFMDKHEHTGEFSNGVPVYSEKKRVNGNGDSFIKDKENDAGGLF